MKQIKTYELSELTAIDGGKFRVETLESAYNFCRKVTINHYENFPVGSILIPKKLRMHFYSVYAFARLSDDIADESDENPKIRIQYLDNLAEQLSKSLKDNNDYGNPVLMALSNTLKEKNIPIEPFLKLLIAFKRDILFEQPKDFNDIKDYCSYSANPVGEIILRIFGLYNDTTKQFSDDICTGLQLINFWQDLSIDLKKGRCYLPHDILQKYSLTRENLHLNENSAILSECLSEIYNYTYSFFTNGNKLIGYLNNLRLKLEINATIKGGERLLEKIKNMGTLIVKERPHHTKFDLFVILFNSFFSG